MNREQPTSSMATTTVNKDGDHSWTYLDLPIQRLDQSRQLHGNLSMLFVIVAWLIVPVTATGLSSLKLRVQRWGLPVAHGKKMASSVHAISTWPEVCAGPSCLQHALCFIARPDSQTLCCTHNYVVSKCLEALLHKTWPCIRLTVISLLHHWMQWSPTACFTFQQYCFTLVKLMSRVNALLMNFSNDVAKYAIEVTKSVKTTYSVHMTLENCACQLICCISGVSL